MLFSQRSKMDLTAQKMTQTECWQLSIRLTGIL